MLVKGRRTNMMNLRRRASIREHGLFGISQEIKTLSNEQFSHSHKGTDAPVLWERKSNGYRIVDLRLDRFVEALRFIQSNFFPAEPLCKASNLYDETASLKVYLRFILKELTQMHSLCALLEGTGSIVGVATLSLHSRKDQFLPKEEETYHGKTFSNVVGWRKRALPELHFCDAIDVERFYYVHILCVEADHQNRGIASSLLRSCIEKARELFIPAVAGHFTSGAAQTVAERLRFEMLREITYEDLGIMNKEASLENINSKSHSIACMFLKIPPMSLQQPLEPAQPARSLSISTQSTKSKSKTGKKRK